jgi:hypothetical protein
LRRKQDGGDTGIVITIIGITATGGTAGTITGGIVGTTTAGITNAIITTTAIITTGGTGSHMARWLLALRNVEPAIRRQAVFPSANKPT